MSSSYDLVTLAQARAHLRSTTSADDNDLANKITASSLAIIRYIDGGGISFLDTSGHPEHDTAGNPLDVPEDVQIAVLMLIGIFYANRDGEAGIINPQFNAGMLPDAVTSILYPFRMPVIS